MIVLKCDGEAFAIGQTLHEAILSAQCKQAAVLRTGVDNIQVKFGHKEIVLAWQQADGLYGIRLNVKEC